MTIRTGSTKLPRHRDALRPPSVALGAPITSCGVDLTSLLHLTRLVVRCSCGDLRPGDGICRWQGGKVSFTVSTSAS
jgi:hypothetical protein